MGFGFQTGRFAGAFFALLSGQLIALFGGSYPVAGSCVVAFYLVGFVATFFMPQSSGSVPLTSTLLPTDKTRESELVNAL
jgi:hypothetical protein